MLSGGACVSVAKNSTTHSRFVVDIALYAVFIHAWLRTDHCDIGIYAKCQPLLKVAGLYMNQY
jgi:hypothetical protein